MTNYGFVNDKLRTIAKSSDSVSTTLDYDQYGRVTSKTDNSTNTVYGYDANDRVNSIVHSRNSDNGVLHQEWYSYDAANNLQTKIVNSAATSYTYDNIDQLLTEIGGGINDTYAYDAKGNRTSKISSGVTELYTYDDADKLLTRGSTSYTYDACGRTKTIVGSGGTRTFTWDYEDRLTNLTGGGVPSTNYGYNGIGTRTSKSNSGGSRNYKRNGVGVTAPVLSDGVATMVPGIAEKSGGVTSTIHSDRLGSMKGLSASGTLTDTVNYDAFGKVVARTGTNSTQKGFVSDEGYQEDGESGYKLLGHRYYDAESGRFLSRDPIQNGCNWYTYCENNPLVWVDPEGLQVAVGAGAGGLTVLAGEVAAGGGFNPVNDAIAAGILLFALVVLVADALPKAKPIDWHDSTRNGKKNRNQDEQGKARQTREQEAARARNTPKVKNPRTQPDKTSEDYLRKGPKPKPGNIPKKKMEE